jgi:hypothetical protein
MKFDTTPFMSRDHQLTCQNQAWAIEFAVLDLDCRPLLMMVVDVHAHTRFPLSATSSLAMPEDVVGMLERLVRRSGKPEEVWIDHGFGHGRAALQSWAEQYRIPINYGLTLQTRALTKPLLRDLAAFLRGNRFASLTELGNEIERWRASSPRPAPPFPTSTSKRGTR